MTSDSPRAAGADSQRTRFARRTFLKAATGVAPGWAVAAVAASRADAPPVDPPAPGALVLYQSGETWEQVMPAAGAAAGTPVERLDLVGHALARVQFRGSAYRVEREGLYRFMSLPRGVVNLVSLRERTSLFPLLQSLAALHVHGNRHDADTVDRLKARLRAEPWVCLTCGNIAALAASVLNAEGYKTRRVSSNTREKPNGYDDGHSLFEVQWPQANKWVLVDADMGLLFKDGPTFLDARELARRVKDDKRPEFVVLAHKAAVLDPFFLGPDGHNYALEFRWRWATPEGKWSWYRRVMQEVRVEG